MNPPLHQVGCDFSHLQGTINWGSLYNNTAFTLMKATEGTSFADPQFKTNQTQARDLKMPRGFYHFAGSSITHTVGNANQEADLFTNHVAAPQQGEWLILDWEQEYSAPVDWCLNWFQKVTANTDSKPGGILYIDVDRLRRYNWQAVLNFGVSIWVANPDNLPVPYPYIMQQYGEKIFPGISGNVDADFFHLGMDVFENYGYQVPQPHPTVAPAPASLPIPITPSPAPAPLPTTPSNVPVVPEPPTEEMGTRVGGSSATLWRKLLDLLKALFGLK